MGASVGHMNVLRAKKGFYFQLDSIVFLYMGEEIEAKMLIKRKDYTLQWFINHTYIRFSSEYTWEPETREHFFGNFDIRLGSLYSFKEFGTATN